MISKSQLFIFGVLFLVVADTVNAQQSVNVCTDLRHGTLVRNVQNCGSYFHCFNGQPLLSECPTGQLFNHWSRQCDSDIENVECFQCPETPKFLDIHVPNECNQFVRCFNRQPQQLTCADGLKFDRDIQMCNLFEHAPCPFEVSCPRNHSHLIFTRDRDECSRYFMCIEGNLVEKNCPSNLHFNPVTNMCDLPENTDCTTWNNGDDDDDDDNDSGEDGDGGDGGEGGDSGDSGDDGDDGNEIGGDNSNQSSSSEEN